jgi:hypothetical protein
MLARRALPLLALAALVGGAACSRSPQSVPAAAPEPSGTAATAPDAPPPTTPTPAAPERAVQEAVEVPPGEDATTAPLSADAETVVDPASSFRVVLAGTCRDARLLLLDAAGVALPASERAEVGATTVLRLIPTAPLVPGSRYQLRLDGALGRELHLGDHAYPPSRFALRAAGDPPPPAPKGVSKKKRRKQ